MVRLQDLQSYQPQLQRYKESSVSFDGWIEATRKKQQTLQATKMDNVQTLTDHINQQKVSTLTCFTGGALSLLRLVHSGIVCLYFCAVKALNSEIKSKREILDGVLRDNTACGNSIRVRPPSFCSPLATVHSSKRQTLRCRTMKAFLRHTLLV